MTQEIIFTPEQAWKDLVDKQDRTSPEEYPDMALISFAELSEYMLGAALLQPVMTVDDLVELITNPNGGIYPFSYAAHTMEAHGVNRKLVQYFHDAAARENKASHDRHMILADFVRATANAAAEAVEARKASFLRHNPHMDLKR